ncbi:hypothetical protein ACNAW0_24520 [Micromonospora sp. SL1-18]|uniref:hypothetical protein n=1 Tax=Micromonospora sp. SL1-18 TaxID=3399128 RepID=UPI003A4DE603
MPYRGDAVRHRHPLPGRAVVEGDLDGQFADTSGARRTIGPDRKRDGLAGRQLPATVEPRVEPDGEQRQNRALRDVPRLERPLRRHLGRAVFQRWCQIQRAARSELCALDRPPYLTPERRRLLPHC